MSEALREWAAERKRMLFLNLALDEIRSVFPKRGHVELEGRFKALEGARIAMRRRSRLSALKACVSRDRARA